MKWDNKIFDIENPRSGYYWVIERSYAQPIYIHSKHRQDDPYFTHHDGTNLPMDYLQGFDVYPATDSVKLDDEPRSPPIAYLQDFLNDSRFDMLVSLMPSVLVEKFYDRIVSLQEDRDSWKIVAKELEEE
jgi:hypothetical protein